MAEGKVARQEAEARQYELDRDTIMINSFRRSLAPLLQPAPRPQPTTNCTTRYVGGVLMTSCN